MLLGIPIWGLASAVNTVISNIIGQNKIDDVIKATIKSVHISFSINLVICAAIYFFPHFFISFWTNDAALIEQSIPTLKIILLVMMFFSVGAMTMHSIIGIGDTKAMLVMEMVCIASYSIYTYCAVFVWHLSLHQVWLAELIYWTLLPTFSITYLAFGNWKKVALKV